MATVNPLVYSICIPTTYAFLVMPARSKLVFPPYLPSTRHRFVFAHPLEFMGYTLLFLLAESQPQSTNDTYFRMFEGGNLVGGKEVRSRLSVCKGLIEVYVVSQTRQTIE